MFQIVWIATGKPYEGTIPPAPDELAVKVALANMLEDVAGLRGKLRVERVK
jgi:hypothetical protein